ncbi:hypothetical protein ACRAWF_02115 [Streptomyces sp. L7]
MTGTTLAQKISEGSVVIGPAVRIGRNAEIGPGVKLRFSDIGDGVDVDEGARLSRTAIGDGAVVGPYARITDSYVGPLCARALRARQPGPAAALRDRRGRRPASRHPADRVSVYPQPRVPAVTGLRPPGTHLTSSDDIPALDPSAPRQLPRPFRLFRSPVEISMDSPIAVIGRNRPRRPASSPVNCSPVARACGSSAAALSAPGGTIRRRRSSSRPTYAPPPPSAHPCTAVRRSSTSWSRAPTTPVPTVPRPPCTGVRHVPGGPARRLREPALRAGQPASM